MSLWEQNAFTLTSVRRLIYIQRSQRANLFDPAFKAAHAPFDVHFARNSPFGVGLKYFYFYVFIFQLVGLFLFFTKQSQKKWTPTSLIVLANPAGLLDILPSLYALPFYDFDLRASHARTLLPAALASVPFGFVLVRVRVRTPDTGTFGHLSSVYVPS